MGFAFRQGNEWVDAMNEARSLIARDCRRLHVSFCAAMALARQSIGHRWQEETVAVHSRGCPRLQLVDPLSMCLAETTHVFIDRRRSL